MKKLLIICAMFFTAFATSAQTRESGKYIEVFGGPGLDFTTDYQFGITMTFGCYLKERIYAGIGTGFRYQDALFSILSNDEGRYHDTEYNYYHTECYIIPIYARIKGNLTSSAISPFFMADIGTNLDVNPLIWNDNKKIFGLYGEPQFGVDIQIGEAQSIFASVGVNIATTNYSRYDSQRTDLFYDVTFDEVKCAAYSLVFHLGFKL